jgi:hypothetical protein
VLDAIRDALTCAFNWGVDMMGRLGLAHLRAVRRAGVREQSAGGSIARQQKR